MNNTSLSRIIAGTLSVSLALSSLGTGSLAFAHSNEQLSSDCLVPAARYGNISRGLYRVPHLWGDIVTCYCKKRGYPLPPTLSREEFEKWCQVEPEQMSQPDSYEVSPSGVGAILWAFSQNRLDWVAQVAEGDIAAGETVQALAKKFVVEQQKIATAVPLESLKHIWATSSNAKDIENAKQELINTVGTCNSAMSERRLKAIRILLSLGPPNTGKGRVELVEALQWIMQKDNASSSFGETEALEAFQLLGYLLAIYRMNNNNNDHILTQRILDVLENVALNSTEPLRQKALKALAYFGTEQLFITPVLNAYETVLNDQTSNTALRSAIVEGLDLILYQYTSSSLQITDQPKLLQMIGLDPPRPISDLAPPGRLHPNGETFLKWKRQKEKKQMNDWNHLVHSRIHSDKGLERVSCFVKQSIDDPNMRGYVCDRNFQFGTCDILSGLISQYLLPALKSDHWIVRATAAWGLWKNTWYPSATNELVQKAVFSALDDPHPAVRNALLETLSKRKYNYCLPLLDSYRFIPGALGDALRMLVKPTKQHVPNDCVDKGSITLSASA